MIFTGPIPVLPRVSRRNTQQNIITLGLELEFLLLGFKQGEGPHALVADALDEGMMVSFGHLNPTPGGPQNYLNVGGLPEVRSSARREFVPWVPPRRLTSVFGNIRRYNRKRFDIMDEEGIDPERFLNFRLVDRDDDLADPEQFTEPLLEEAPEERELDEEVPLPALNESLSSIEQLSEPLLEKDPEEEDETRQPMTAMQLLSNNDNHLQDFSPSTGQFLEMDPEGTRFDESSEFLSDGGLPGIEQLPEPLVEDNPEDGKKPGTVPFITVKQLLFGARFASNILNPPLLPNIIDSQVGGNTGSAAPQKSKSGRASLEISTPVLRERSWLRVVVKMLDSLTALERGPQESPLRIQFNPNTGLHIHVGRRGGWSVHQLKKILKAVVIFKDIMDLMHPDSRHSPSISEYPQSDMFRSNARHMRIHTLSRLERVNLIDLQINSRNSRTREEGLKTLCDIANGRSKATKYNFLGVLTCGTVEFRQAVGTLQIAAVVEWINTVLDFVCAAINTPRENWHGWAREEDDAMMEEDDSSLREFLSCGWEIRNRHGTGNGETLDLEDELPRLTISGEEPDTLDWEEFYDLDSSVEEYRPGDY